MAETAGLFCNDVFLIIQPAQAKFPARCVDCNAETNGAAKPVTLTYMPKRGRGKSVGSAVATIALRKECQVPMPVCERCAKKSHARGNTGAYIGLAAWAIGGILIALVSNSG